MLKNFYTVRAEELEAGDVLVCVVKLMVGWQKDRHGRPIYRLYRCTWPDTKEVIPQGSAVTTTTREIAEALFPVVGLADMRPDPNS